MRVANGPQLGTQGRCTGLLDLAAAPEFQCYWLGGGAPIHFCLLR
jgi:hypothetical protein